MSNFVFAVVALIAAYAVWQFARCHIITGVAVTVFCLVLPTTVYFFDLVRPFVHPGRVCLSVSETVDECTTWFKSMATRGLNDRMTEVQESEEVRKAFVRDAALDLQDSGQTAAADRLLRQDEMVTGIVQQSLQEAANTRKEMSQDVVKGYERQLAAIQLDGAWKQSNLALKIADFQLLTMAKNTSGAETDPSLSESTEADRVNIAFGQFCDALARGNLLQARQLMARETSETLSLSEVLRIRTILNEPFKLQATRGINGDSIAIDFLIDGGIVMNCQMSQQDGSWQVADIRLL